MALKACGCEHQLIQPALTLLAEHQMEDGRVPLLKNIAENFWPTALALLAWDHEPEFDVASRRARDFLLSARSETFPYDGDATMGHNSTLAGWPG